MRMVFTDARDDEFAAARSRLLDALLAWARVRDRTVDLMVAGALLDFRYDHGGLLGRWDADALRTALLSWFPRKVTLLESDRSMVLATIGALLDFLDDADLLDEHSERPAALRHLLIDLAPEFERAMTNPENYGVAKFWAITMAGYGVDPTNEAAAERFIERVQAGEVRYDEETFEKILRKHYHEDPDEPDEVAPPVYLLVADDVLAASARRVPLVRRLRQFVEWVGEGRQLTQNGNFRLSDARELVTLLGTGDRIDPVIGGKRFRTGSSEELRGLTMVYTVARSLRLVRTVKGKLVRVKANAGMLDDPLRLLLAAATTIANPANGLEVAALPWPDAPSLAYGALSALQSAHGPVPMPMLVEMLRDITEIPDYNEPFVEYAVNALVDLGLVAVERAGEEFYPDIVDFADLDTIEDATERDLKVLTLLPLGSRLSYDLLRGNGMPAVTVDDFAEETAEVLIARLTGLPEDYLARGVTCWLAERTTAQATAQLAALAERTDEPDHRQTALDLLGDLGNEGIAAIRSMRDHSTAGPSAVSWLVARELLDPAELSGREIVYGMVDALAAGIRVAGEIAVAEFAEQPEETQLAILADVPASGHPRADEVLETVGTLHPDAAVAEAARTALHRLRGMRPK